jgi:glycosyltransferase involved in cell wall biosynthesis
MSEAPEIQHCFVILAHGECAYLEDCIRSLLAQTYPSRIIMTTSTPSPFQQQLAEKYAIPYRVNTNSAGMAGDWNFALNTTNAKFVTLAHQDDYYLPEYASTLVREMEKNKEVIIGYCDYAILNTSGVRAWTILLFVKRCLLFILSSGKSLISGKQRRALLSLGNPICCPSVTYNREILGGLNFDSAFKINLDWKYWIDLAHQPGTFLYIKKRLILYRTHAETTTHRAIHSGERASEDKRCFRLLWPKLIADTLTWLYAISYKVN